MKELNPVVFAIPFYFILIGLELIYDYFKKAKLYRFNDSVTNISCGIGDQVISVFVKVLTVGVYDLVYTNFAFFDMPNAWWSFLICFILVDFCYYWVHRTGHEVNFLWASHSVHHQSEEYNLSVALRQSWFHKLFTFPYYLPVALLGFETMYFVLAIGFNLLYQFWIHTEAIRKMGWLETVLNTPSHHRVHHGRNPQYIDKNHAGVFIIWDKLFGSFAEEKEAPVYGITTPLASWNPLWANFVHWKAMYSESKPMKGSDRLKMCFKPPGWRPDYLGGTHKIPKVSRDNYLKFNTFSPMRLNIYVLVQYMIALGIGSFFLLNFNQFIWQDKLGFAFLVMFAIVNIGLLLERKKAGYILEYFRIISTMLFGIYLFQNQANFNIWVFAFSISAFATLIWLLTMGKYMKN